MSRASERLTRIIAEMRDSAVDRVEGKVRNYARGIFDEDDDEDDQDEDDEEDDDPEDDDLEDDEPWHPGEDGIDGDGYSFEFTDGDFREDNLAMAAAVWRVEADPDVHIFTQHKATGVVFVGCEEGWQHFKDQRQIRGDWEDYDNDEIMRMDYDPDVMAAVIDGQDPDEADATDKYFENVHWGDKPGTYSLIDLPGVTEQVAFFGVPRCLDVTLDDDAEVRFTHRPESAAIPAMWVPHHGKYIVVHGPGFSAERLLKALRIRPDELTFSQKIPGIDEPVADLGMATRIEYFAVKGGEPEEYYHEHGEATHKYPHVYVPKSLKWYALYGGKMRVEGRGIVE